MIVTGLDRALRLWLRLCLPVLGLTALAANPKDLAQRIREAGLDPSSSLRVRELELRKEDARIFLNEGVLVFLKAIDGRRLGAVFTAESPGDDAEVLLLPPTRPERASLAAFTQSPNLEEHFTSALFLFTDDSAESLERQIRASEFQRPAPEEGALLASRWNPILRNLSASFEARLVEDVLAQRSGRDGIFFAVMAGKTLGNFDLVIDPRMRRQVMLGQISTREDRAFYDIWTNFAGASFRQGRSPLPESGYRIPAYQIDATIGTDLLLRADTVAVIEPSVPLRVIPFEISPRMKITSVEIDGQPAEFFRPESLRSNLIRGDQNDAFLVAPAVPLAPGTTHRIRIRHEGEVISEVGRKIYFVGSRVNWYPQRGGQFSEYELTFRYPKELTLVSSGEVVEDRVEGAQQITRRRTGRIRFAGFNLGQYESASSTRGGLRLDIYANRELEASLAPRPMVLMTPPATNFPRRTGGGARAPELLTLPPVSAGPASRMRPLAEEIAWAMEWMTARFGPPPSRNLSVSPIPGNFGQGFPGLIYLSTRAFVDFSESSKERQIFFEELLPIHEAAHQWWGNLVTSAGYEDDWLQEAIANYLALMGVEKRRGTGPFETMLSSYRERLLTKDADGREPAAAGAVTLGLRLQNSQNANAWRTVIYDKGSWILHMLRRRLGDEPFWSLLTGIAQRYREQALTTEDFRAAAVAALAQQPPGPDRYATLDPQLDSFFDTWVYGTGVPRLKLATSLRGKAPKLTLTVTVTQSDVEEDFSDFVPIEITVARNRVIRRWVRTGSEPAVLTIPLTASPLKVLLDPGGATLRR